MDSIAVLDLQDFTGGRSGNESEFIARLGAAFAGCGFVALGGHGIPDTLLQQARTVTRRLFALPTAQLEACSGEHLRGQRGYTRFGMEHARDHPVPDLKEFWHVGREEDSAETGRLTPNIWPADWPEFRQVTLALYAELDRVAGVVLEACALWLGEDRSRFRAMVTGGNSILRLIHYPPLADERPAGSLRAAPHEDINFITLLPAATDAGLEILVDGTWLAVQTPPGCIIVDTGDMIQNLTNGVMRSTTHRVVNPDHSGGSRYATPFFVHARDEVQLDPLPSCISRVGQQNYPAIRAGDYLQQRLREIGL